MNEPREIRVQILGPTGEYLQRYRHLVDAEKLELFEEMLSAMFMKWENEDKGRKL